MYLLLNEPAGYSSFGQTWSINLEDSKKDGAQALVLYLTSPRETKKKQYAHTTDTTKQHQTQPTPFFCAIFFKILEKSERLLSRKCLFFSRIYSRSGWTELKQFWKIFLYQHKIYVALFRYLVMSGPAEPWQVRSSGQGIYWRNLCDTD